MGHDFSAYLGTTDPSDPGNIWMGGPINPKSLTYGVERTIRSVTSCTKP